MLITEHILYFELHKTGCMYTRDLLSALYGGRSKIIGVHNAYDTISKSDLGSFEKKLRVGNIRNPWDWYVSLWAFGCMKKGGLYHRVTNNSNKGFGNKVRLREWMKKSLYITYPKIDPERWIKLYSDPYNTEHFNEWLNFILFEEQHDLGETYKRSKLSKVAGLLTYRYLKLFTYEGRRLAQKIDSESKLFAHDKKNNFLDIIIRNESIQDDIRNYADELHIELKSLDSLMKDFSSKTNESLRNRDYRTYYNDSSIELVQEKEKLIIAKYNYQFDNYM